MSLLSKLEFICSELYSKVYAVNNGGCGFVAKAFAEKLTPILGEENVKIRYVVHDTNKRKKLTQLRGEYTLSKDFFLQLCTMTF